MKTYTIGEIGVLLGLKPHVIRYWEKEFPFVKPKRSLTGRRLYTERELQVLFRLKYLLHEKKLTLEGAQQTIWEELDSRGIDVKLAVQEIRGELLDLLTHVNKEKDTNGNND
jgi:DNA-binding transcriptional MerR regulator